MDRTKKIADDKFCELIEKKVRKNIRMNFRIVKNDSIIVVGEIARHFIGRIIRDPTVNIEYSDTIKDAISKKTGQQKIICDGSIEQKIKKYLLFLFEDKKQDDKPDSIITITDCLLNEELERYAKLKKIKYERQKQDDIDAFVDSIEKKHKGSKHSFAKSIEKLDKIL